MKGKRITKEELDDVISFANEGLKDKEISELTGKSLHAIQQIKYRLRRGDYEDLKKEEKKFVEKTLNDFTPREIFKHLYGIGVRINEHGKLVCVVKRPVDDEEMAALGYCIEDGKLLHIEEREINIKDVIENG